LAFSLPKKDVLFFFLSAAVLEATLSGVALADEGASFWGVCGVVVVSALLDSAPVVTVGPVVVVVVGCLDMGETSRESTAG
jgi:hypothetical protein